MDDDHVVVFFVILMLFFRGEVRRFVWPFVEVLAQVGDQHCLKFKRDVTVRHGVGGHGLWSRRSHRVKGSVDPCLEAEAVVEEEVSRAERNDIGSRGFVVVHRDVRRAEKLHVHKVTAHGLSELLHVVGGDHDGSKAVLGFVTGAEAAGEARGNQHQGKEQRLGRLQVHGLSGEY